MIQAKIIAYSRSGTDSREAVTFELDYPRYIHSELMTHRVFSRNAASSRAVPIDKVIEQIKSNTVMPLWSANQSGMQGKIITNGAHLLLLTDIWLNAAMNAIKSAEELSAAGAHKQNVNRILEPFQHMKTIVTAAEVTNFFSLRNHPDAQPEIRALAREMYIEYCSTEPKILGAEQWHLPYADEGLELEDALKVSASCCAQVSYRLADDSVEKAIKVYDRLVGGTPLHASPFEHQCRLLNECESQKGNLVGFYQYRTTIEADYAN